MRTDQMMKRIGFLVVLASFLAPLEGRTHVIPELVAQLRDGLSWIDSSMPTENACEKEDAWFFRRFWLRLRPKATFELPGLKLTLVPEVELLLERDYPDGWGTYKP
jgi:hypothetical protein